MAIASIDSPTLELVRVGRRAVLAHDVDRYPFALVPAGTAGTIVIADSELVQLRVDDTFVGLSEWGNGVEWYDRDGAGAPVTDAREAFLQDVRVIA